VLQAPSVGVVTYAGSAGELCVCVYVLAAAQAVLRVVLQHARSSVDD
jgi:hypothetical protein